jgi:putative ABC transport system substrate-binding protein
MRHAVTRWLLVAAIWIFGTAAWAQGKAATVGVLTFFSAADYAANFEQLRRGLRDLGYVEGRNLSIEARHADAKLERLPQLAVELESVPVDVLVTTGSHVTRVARKTTRKVPIVMAYAGDPVGGGFADSLARPGGRITGLTVLTSELAGKRLELLREMLPRIEDVAVLWNPDVPERVIQFRETLAAAKTFGITVHSAEARRAAEIEPALRTLVAKRPDAVIVLGDALTAAHTRPIAAFTAKHKLVTIYQLREGAQLGGLLYYGPSFANLHYRAATYVDRILKGAKPGDLPIEQPTQFELVVNLKTAKTLGIRIPQSVLARADAVID